MRHILVQLRRSEAALTVLQQEKDAKGRQLIIRKLYLPPALHYTEAEIDSLIRPLPGRAAGQRLAASYVNFYLCNGGLICPAFGGAAAEADVR